jgi:hypothetical protein
VLLSPLPLKPDIDCAGRNRRGQPQRIYAARTRVK